MAQHSADAYAILRRPLRTTSNSLPRGSAILDAVMTPEMTLTALRGGHLLGVRELDLSRCGLTQLPSEVFGVAETLETLDLSGNDLTTLPDDFNRLQHLKVLFCSGNRFNRLPPVLGDCPALSQLGFRRAGVREVPEEALPPRLRWLTLTDNALERLPEALGHRPELQKLMLSGNRLQSLPMSLSGALRLELIRLGANRFETLAPWLLELPSLAWLAWAGNPLDQDFRPSAPLIAWDTLGLGRLLGEGASGKIYEAAWWLPSGPKAVAVKLFKGEMTSDGVPEREMAACLAAGRHARLTGSLGEVSGHPDRLKGLVMPLLPPHWRPLAGPPSLESCSRDVYDSSLRLPLVVGLQIARSVGEAVSHLQGMAMQHGDVYAHNTLWDGVLGQATLTDFGAASFWPAGVSDDRLMRLEVLAWGRLLTEIIKRCDLAEPSSGLLALGQACTSPVVGARPSMADALSQLSLLL